jgi:hypothetical protein
MKQKLFRMRNKDAYDATDVMVGNFSVFRFRVRNELLSLAAYGYVTGIGLKTEGWQHRAKIEGVTWPTLEKQKKVPIPVELDFDTIFNTAGIWTTTTNT